LSEESVRRVLKDLGLTEKETDIYIFLAKHGTLKGGEIAQKAKTHKALVYRILGKLQGKGLVKSTLEAPARFAAEPFETILDMNIKAKQEEAALLENTKNELLSYWNKISQVAPEPSLEKFLVIEGDRKIYPKISQMIKETKHQFSAIVTIPALIRAEQYGLFDTAFGHPLKSEIEFRFLTELNAQNLNAVKNLLAKIPKTKLKLKGRNPDIGLQLSSRMVMRDDAEMLFFITPRTANLTAGHDEVCLWTNCEELMHAFKAVFEEGWQNSSDIEKIILEVETGRSIHGTLVKSDAETAGKNYEEIMSSAKKEILMLTSSEGLIVYSKKAALVKEWAKRGVSLKIMAPITSENLKAAEELSKLCEVRHVPVSYLKTTIVDGTHLFQFEVRRFGKSLGGQEESFEPNFKDIVYSKSVAHVERMKLMLDDIWRNSVAPSTVTLDLILKSESTVFHFPEPSATYPVEIPQTRFYGFPTYCSAQAVIHTPAQLNMPDMLIEITHFGEPTDEKGNRMSISLWLNTPKGYRFVPTVIVLSRGRKDRIASELENINKAIYAGSPAGHNVLRVKEHEFQIWKQGNTLFAGWTVPIPVLPPKLFLPPSFLLFEGYGNSMHFKYSVTSLSGWKSTIENDGSEAFVTFMSPSLRYTGPGTDGRLCTKGYSSVTSPTK
jgi:sugar-specific transcriptional regulator TrmB